VRQAKIDHAIDEFNSKVFSAADINSLRRYIDEKTFALRQGEGLQKDIILIEEEVHVSGLVCNDPEVGPPEVQTAMVNLFMFNMDMVRVQRII
jgi:hypothetical protein